MLRGEPTAATTEADDNRASTRVGRSRRLDAPRESGAVAGCRCREPQASHRGRGPGRGCLLVPSASPDVAIAASGTDGPRWQVWIRPSSESESESAARQLRQRRRRRILRPHRCDVRVATARRGALAVTRVAHRVWCGWRSRWRWRWRRSSRRHHPRRASPASRGPRGRQQPQQLAGQSRRLWRRVARAWRAWRGGAARCRCCYWRVRRKGGRRCGVRGAGRRSRSAAPSSVGARSRTAGAAAPASPADRHARGVLGPFVADVSCVFFVAGAMPFCIRLSHQHDRSLTRHRDVTLLRAARARSWTHRN